MLIEIEIVIPFYIALLFINSVIEMVVVRKSQKVNVFKISEA